MRVFKYPLFKEINLVELPQGSKILRITTQVQSDGLKVKMMWALVNLAAPPVMRVFQFFGTGQEIPPFATYVTTMDDPPFVWHIFELPYRGAEKPL